MNKQDIKTITKLIKNREMLIQALKKIRDSQESDLGVYAKFCVDTATEALLAVENSTSTPSTPKKQAPLQ